MSSKKESRFIAALARMITFFVLLFKRHKEITKKGADKMIVFIRFFKESLKDCFHGIVWVFTLIPFALVHGMKWGSSHLRILLFVVTLITGCVAITINWHKVSGIVIFAGEIILAGIIVITAISLFEHTVTTVGVAKSEED